MMDLSSKLPDKHYLPIGCMYGKYHIIPTFLVDVDGFDVGKYIRVPWMGWGFSKCCHETI